jgi:hypothetical protein
LAFGRCPYSYLKSNGLQDTGQKKITYSKGKRKKILIMVATGYPVTLPGTIPKEDMEDME